MYFKSNTTGVDRLVGDVGRKSKDYILGFGPDS